jgi:hypothetical protein
MKTRTAARPRIPSPFELCELIDNVISDWAFLPVQMAGRPAPGPARLDFEYSVLLKGDFACRLMLRGNRLLAADLAQAATGDPGAREQAEDAFRELCNLMASHLLSRFFPEASPSFGPFFPVPSTTESWPTLPPDSECVAIVSQHALEARLWMGVPHG